MFRLRTDRVVPIDKEELEVVRYSSSHDIEMEEVPLANHLPIKKRVDSGERDLPELEAEAEDVEIEKSKSAEQRAKGSANNNSLVSKQYSEDKSSLSSPTGNDKSNLPDVKELLMRRNSRLGNDNELSASIITASTTSSSISSSSSSLSRRKSFRKSDNPIDLMPTASLSTSSSALPPQRSSVERRGSRQFLNLPTLAPPPILLLPFDAFVKAGAMPRFPDERELCHRMEDIDREKSFIIFISHCWARRYAGTPAWDGNPHPDTPQWDNYQLCVDGIQSIVNSLLVNDADRLSCYLWLDYSCLNQDGDASLNSNFDLVSVMRMSDCLFTPVLGEWSGNKGILDKWASDYDALGWTQPEEGYTSRSWCRLEAFLASAVPLDMSPSKQNSFKGGFQLAMSYGRRPHLIYGSYERRSKRPPLFLPPLPSSLFAFFDPREGQSTIAADANTIARLVEDLLLHLRFTAVGWSGQHDEEGRPVGEGEYTFESGSSFIGTAVNGAFHGSNGTMKYANGNIYVGDWVEGKRTGKGRLRSMNGVEYEGEYLCNQRHGTGKYIYASGASYCGQWVADKMHGKGLFNYMDGSSYEGSFIEDTVSGQGVYRYANGNVYSGEWKSGKRHGRGICTYANGATYEGDFVEDMRHGVGVFTTPNDFDVYAGEFVNDERTGTAMGTLTSSDGGVYHGELVEGRMSGFGLYTWPGGNTYQGFWVDGAMTGKGLYRWSGGKGEYDGFFVNGVRHGVGKFSYADGSVFIGDFVNDTMEGQGVYTYADGSMYDGSWRKGERHGKGIFRDSRGNVYEGNYIDGACSGVGKLTYSNGDVYEGEWLNDRRHGEGIMRHKDGRVFEGDFAEGKFVLRKNK